MPSLRGEEVWVKACMEAALPGVVVLQHDDGSLPGMHDLDLFRSEEKFGAVEVSAAADADSIELWKLINGRGRWIESRLTGGWSVHLLPSARAKRVRSELPALLADLEAAGVKEIEGSSRRQNQLEQTATNLDVAYAWHGETNFKGSIYVSIELPSDKSGGMVSDTGDALANWLGYWLLESQQADILAKLSRSDAAERHAFVLFPGFNTAPFAVSDLLMRTAAPLPTVPPALPPPVTDVWTMSTWSSGDGFRWSARNGWSRFAKVRTSVA